VLSSLIGLPSTDPYLEDILVFSVSITSLFLFVSPSLSLSLSLSLSRSLSFCPSPCPSLSFSFSLFLSLLRFQILSFLLSLSPSFYFTVSICLSFWGLDLECSTRCNAHCNTFCPRGTAKAVKASFQFPLGPFQRLSQQRDNSNVKATRYCKYVKKQYDKCLDFSVSALPIVVNTRGIDSKNAKQNWHTSITSSCVIKIERILPNFWHIRIVCVRMTSWILFLSTPSMGCLWSLPLGSFPWTDPWPPL